MVINMIIAFTLSAVMAAIFTPLTIKLAKKIGIMDIPNDARKIQKEPMPRLGGLAFIMSLLISSLSINGFSIIDLSIREPIAVLVLSNNQINE